MAMPVVIVRMMRMQMPLPSLCALARSRARRKALNLDGQMRQCPKSIEQPPVMFRASRPGGSDRQNGPQMTGAKAPEMQVGDTIAIDLDGGLHSLGHAS